MNLLTTVAEVHALAFSSEELVNKEVITLSDILEAETRFVRPILGDALFDAVANGAYPALRSDYLLPVVAAWSRYVVEPLLQQRCLECHTLSRSAADNEHLRVLMRQLRRRASTLSRRLSDHLNAHKDEYAEYNPNTNPLNHCSIYGDIIQVY